MVKNADALFGIKTYPHIDYYEASYHAAKVLTEILNGKCRPCTEFRKIPMLVSPECSSTLTGAGLDAKTYFEKFTREHNLIDAEFFHGWAGMDSVTDGASVIVIADAHKPKDEADRLANYVFEMRGRFNEPERSASEAVDTALELLKNGYVVINEGTDNPGSGCPGDGTHLLAEFIRRDLPRSIMGPLFDPDSAAECHKHKIGDCFSLNVGGKHHPAFGKTLKLDGARLLALSDGDFVCDSPVHKGAVMHYGPSARLKYGNVEFIVVSNRFQTYDDRPYLMLGAQMSDYSVVGLKSSNHFKAYFAEQADAIISADTPSLFPKDLRKIEYHKVARPIYPLDKDTAFEL